MAATFTLKPGRVDDGVTWRSETVKCERRCLGGEPRFGERKYIWLKTWLRNNRTQSRLNSVAVCHVHQKLPWKAVLTYSRGIKFISRSATRKSLFGIGGHWC